MNRTIIAKTVRESWFMLAVLVVAVMLFEILFVLAVSSFSKELIEMWSKFHFLRGLVQALAGADLTADVNATSFMSIGFAHPFLYAVTWAFLLTTCTRVIVGEIDRGTSDLLLTLPISRASHYISVSAVWIAMGIPICVAVWVGILIGPMFLPRPEPIDMRVLWLPVANLFALYVAIGCMTMMLSSFMTRRGPAVGLTLGLLLAGFVHNFICTLTPEMKSWGFLSLLSFYRPLESIRAHALPWGDVGVLMAFAAVSWGVGLVKFQSRDLPAA